MKVFSIKVRSTSDARKKYTVVMHGKTPKSCSCFGWIYRHHERPSFKCKHMKALVKKAPAVLLLLVPTAVMGGF